MKPVAIVGNYPSSNIPFDKDIDVWAINARGTLLPRVDALFQIHRKDKGFYEADGFYEWMKENKTLPIYMREKFEEIPMCIPFPYEGVYKLTSNVKHRSTTLKYLTSTPAMAVALAIYQGRTNVEVYGIEMDIAETYFFQRDCFTFWLGVAAGRGIIVDIYCADKIFRQELYSDK